MSTKRPESPEAQWKRFLARYEPAIARQAAAARTAMRALLPGAHELVYDNYNALVLGFAASDQPKRALVSIALYPRWVTVFFLRGAALADPGGVLEGRGATIRGVRLVDGRTLATPAIRALVRAATAGHPFGGGSLTIRAVVAKQRPRRPGRPERQRRTPGQRRRT